MSTFSEGKRMLVTNGDVFTTLDLEKLLAFHRAHGGIATIAVQPARSRSTWAWCSGIGMTASAATSKSHPMITPSAWESMCSSRVSSNTYLLTCS
jgi:hypothetical protein